MFCGTLEFRGDPVEEYWARLYFSTHAEIHFDEQKSNYTFFGFAQKCFLNPKKRFYSQVENLGAYESLVRAFHSHTFAQSSTILLSCTTSYKDYDQTLTTTQYSINQPCSESAKFDSSELISVLRTVLHRHVKSLLIEHPWYKTVYCLSKITIA